MDSDKQTPTGGKRFVVSQYPLVGKRRFRRSGTLHRISLGKIPSAFSLLELLVVVAIIAILSVLSITGFQSILTSLRMDQAGRAVLDEINLARQLAVTRNENVELRFIRRPRTDGSAADVYWQLSAGVLNKTNATNFSPARSASSLPAGTAIEAGTTLSPLLFQGAERTNTSPSYKYVALTIRPTGEIEPAGMPPMSQLPNWCLTIVPERQLGRQLDEIKDFVTIQIDPLTARPRHYRP